MDLQTLKYCAKYPFTDSAKKIITELGIDFNNLPEENIDFSYQSLLSLMIKKYLTSSDIENSKENFLQKYLIAYPVSNIIINLSKSPFLKTKYARMKSIQTRKFLEGESKETIQKLANELFEIENDQISMQEYLRNLPQGNEFKLMYQNLENGKIGLNENLIKNLIAEKSFNLIMKTPLVKMNYPKSIIYYAEDYDELQNQVIPDNTRIMEYLEAYLKYKTFETISNQITDETFNQIEKKLQRYEMKANEAFVIALTEVKKQTVWEKQRGIKRTQNRLSRYNLPFGRHRY